MLRSDGKFEFYQIQHRISPYRRWVTSNLDHFGVPPGFEANSACWQKTGRHGTFDLGEGILGLDWIRKRNEGNTFRLVLMKVWQTTLPVPE